MPSGTPLSQTGNMERRLAPHFLEQTANHTQIKQSENETVSPVRACVVVRGKTPFQNTPKTRTTMIIMPIKEGENIERALKKFKRKYEKTGVIKELRARQYFTKPSVKNRVQRLKAIYVQGLQREEE